MIPKIIHCIWLGGPKTELAKKCRASWEKYAPGWEIREHDHWSCSSTDGDGDVPEYVKAAVKAKKWAFVSDWLRFAVLEREGGVYCDYDFELLGPIDDLLDREWTAGEFVKRGSAIGMAACVMALEKGSAVARRMLEVYAKAKFTIDQTVGDLMAVNGIELETLAPEIFCPFDRDGRLHVTPATRGIHHYTLSWITPRRRFAGWLNRHGLSRLVDFLVAVKHRLVSRPEFVNKPPRKEGRPRIVIAWPGFTGYSGPLLKALSERCELKVYIESSNYEQQFDDSSMNGVPFERVDAGDASRVIDEVIRFSPDLTMIVGWATPISRALASAAIPGRKVLAFDMPWEWSLKKILARWVLRPRLSGFDAAFVPGEACAKYARWLGFKDGRLMTGVNSSGWERFKDSVSSSELGFASRRRFLFVGRFSAVKGIDLLFKAYSRYCGKTDKPWPLDLVGSGEELPKTIPDGVKVIGFVPPQEMPRVMAEHSVLVLPSAWEPWGVAAAEAMSAGLATILSDRCGIAIDIAPTVLFKYGDVNALAAAMLRLSRMPEAAFADEAERVRSAAERYSALHWTDRMMELAK